VATCPIPVVIAGGPKTDTLLARSSRPRKRCALAPRGAVVGRNLWGHGDTTMAARAFKFVIHKGMAPEEALAAAGRLRRVAPASRFWASAPWQSMTSSMSIGVFGAGKGR
jgi:hypothetical protein